MHSVTGVFCLSVRLFVSLSLFSPRISAALKQLAVGFCDIDSNRFDTPDFRNLFDLPFQKVSSASSFERGFESRQASLARAVRKPVLSRVQK
jgi:hypothetical protein